MGTHTDAVRDFFRRQYDAEQGAPQDNVDTLFADDLVYHLARGGVMGRSGVTLMASQIRLIPRQERRVVLSDVREQDDRVSFRLSLRANDPETGEPTAYEEEQTWLFDDVGQVTEVWPVESDDIERVFGELPNPRQGD